MRVAVLVPAFKRPEYTEKCIRALEEAQDYHGTDFYLVDDGSNDGTSDILRYSTLPGTVICRKENLGLRQTIIDFFKEGQYYDFLMKMDNDCKVPKNWMNDILKIFETTDVDILSPNVFPSDAAEVYGSPVEGLPYIPTKLIGGLWSMRSHLVKDIIFEDLPIGGITGAWQLLNQIVVEKEPKMGWLKDVVVQDIGHWSGTHPEHLKTNDHAEYSAYVGRRTAW